MLLKVVTESPESLREVLNTINGVEGVANTKTIISLANPIREKKTSIRGPRCLHQRHSILMFSVCTLRLIIEKMEKIA